MMTRGKWIGLALVLILLLFSQVACCPDHR